MSSFQPYFSNQTDWNKHFNHSKKKSSTKSFYTLKSENNMPDSSIKLITSTAQGVEQAESELKRKYAELVESGYIEDTINKPPKKSRYQSVKRSRKIK